MPLFLPGYRGQIQRALCALKPIGTKLAFMGANTRTEGKSEITDYRYIFGRINGGVIELHLGPDDTAQLTKYGIESRMSDLEQNGWKKPTKTFDTDESAALPDWVVEYFTSTVGWTSYRFETYISDYQDDWWRRDFTKGWDRASNVAIALLVLFVGWAIVQVVFLGRSVTEGPPSRTAELMFLHKQTTYVALLSLHAFAISLGSLMLVWEIFNVREMSWRGEGRALHKDTQGAAPLGWVLLAAFPLLFVISFLASNFHPRYEVFADMSSEQVVRRDTRLLPFGESQHVVPFGSLDEIQMTEVVDLHGEANDVREVHYRLSVVTRDGEHVEIGWSGHDDSSHRNIFSLAQAMSDKSGAPLDDK